LLYLKWVLGPLVNRVVGVRFREAGHIYYFAPGKSEYIYNEKVLVESQQSKQLATVAIVNRLNRLFF
jgi:cell fate regulator YaaT (PSP1 superfamily)